MAPGRPRQRVASGVADLDGLCGGGLLRDSITLVAGPTGTGKTLLSLEFLASAAQRGERGLLLGTPSALALHGSRRLYDWADGLGRAGHGIVRPVEYTHDISRLSSDPGPLIALNTALEIDGSGQVNVEGVAGSAAGMIGGHPDFAAAAARGPGLSVIALPASHRGRPTLVEHLGGPVTTPSHDVDVVVTERGTADLRGLGRRERERALAALWSGAVGANE